MSGDEFHNHLCRRLIPFWKKLQDLEYGGFYGWMDFGLKVDREAVKGCILNSRILWFFSNASLCLQRDGTVQDMGTGETDSLQECACWAYRFLREKCLDRERGGVYWSLSYKGEPKDTTKHTYNQAFAVYALSSYCRAYHDREALQLAEELIQVIETRCFDEHGYQEALDLDFYPVANDKLSENGVMADRTMNTLLHVLEAYTEYLAACKEAEHWGESLTKEISGEAENCKVQQGGSGGHGWNPQGQGAWQSVVEEKLHWILNLVAEHVYNPTLRRQEVFFNLNMESLIDLHSYGHDIEAAWLIDRCLETLEDKQLTARMSPILRSLEAEVYEKAYAHHSLANECERGVVDEKRVWWVQAEAVVGFYNAYQKTGEHRYLEAAEDIWEFIKAHLVDERPEGEWFWYTDGEGNPAWDKPIVEPWKCPYHNGRMCMEIMGRSDARR